MLNYLTDQELGLSFHDDQRTFGIGSGLGLWDFDDGVRGSFVDERHPFGEFSLLELLQLGVVVDSRMQVVHDFAVFNVHAKLPAKKKKFFLLSTTPTLMAFAEVTDAPGHQPAACMSPSTGKMFWTNVGKTSNVAFLLAN